MRRRADAQTGDPRTDPDIARLRRRATSRRQPARRWQTWYAQRIGGALGPRRAGSAAAARRGPRRHAHHRAFRRAGPPVPDGGAQPRRLRRPRPRRHRRELRHPRRAGHRRQPARRARRRPSTAGDPLGRIVMRYAYDMLGNRIHQLSMEAGARWMLNDVAGKPIRAWDSRGHNFRTAYDALRRPVEQTVRGTDAPDSDPRTLEPRHPGRQDRIRRAASDSPGSRAALNLRTRIYRHFDSAGVATNARLDANGNPLEAYDFKGNLLRSTRRLVSDYTAIPDWLLEPAARRRDLRGQHPLRRAQPPDPVDRAAQQPARGAKRQRHPAGVQRGQPAGAGGRMAGARRRTRRAARPGTPRRRRRSASPTSTTTPRASAAHRLQERRQHLLRLRPADLPPDAPAHPARRAASSPTTAKPAPPRHHRRAGPPGKLRLQNLHYTYDPAGNITHIRDDAQQTDLLPQQARRAEQRLHLRRALPADPGDRPRAPGAAASGDRNPPTAPDAFNAFHTPARPSRATATPWARTSSATCTTPSATSCRCSTAAATRRMPAGRAPTTTTRPA